MREVPDMFSIRNKVAGSLLAAVTTSTCLLTPVSPAQAAYQHDLHATLHGASAYPNARGGAEYHSGFHMGREFDVRIRGIRALAGQTLRVYVHNSLVARMRVSGSGGAFLHRHSALSIARGDVIRLRAPSGRTVASGTFRRFGHHM